VIHWKLESHQFFGGALYPLRYSYSAFSTRLGTYGWLSTGGVWSQEVNNSGQTAGKSLAKRKN